VQTRLREIVQHVAPRLEGLDDAVASRKPGADVWSPKEILGHLVDSAQHNHARFVGLGLEDGQEFPGDDQNAWVRFQRWQERGWLIERLPDASLEHQGTAFLSRRTVTLRWLVEHYVEHLEHHLRQIDERAGRVS
jgi:uncharacterized damage-inducible protein DinB